MKRLVRYLSFAILLVVFAAQMPSPARADEPNFSTAPTLHNGKKWRIGYLEGGQYPDYEVILKATVRGLIKLHWIEPFDIPAENSPTPGGFWHYMAETAKSNYIEFVPDAYYNCGNFDASLRPEVKKQLIKRLTETKDIDLMIAMGTWAGQDLANNLHHVPTVVMSTSDPVGSGIVKSAEDSGYDQLNAKVELDRYARQVEMFYSIFGFSRLGIVYEDSPEGRTFGGLDQVEEVAKANHFELVRCFAAFNNVEQDVAEANVVQCYKQLAEQVDAVYITVHRGVSKRTLPKIIDVLNKNKVPSFSMLGSDEVSKGVLMSISQAGYLYVGQFHAETIAKILNGAKPRSLDQRWTAPTKIALNMKTAEAIGYDPDVAILLASDEIFQN